MENSKKIKVAEKTTNTEPTERQKVSGNYKKGKVILKGLKVTIENPQGSIRSGVDGNGEAWSTEMLFTYGYFNGTVGKDGDAIDVYLGPDIDGDFDVYIVDQVQEVSRAFDEHKVMFGFKDEKSAKEAYLSCYTAGWTGFQNITTVSLSKFKKWLKNKDAIKYPAKRLSMSSKIDYKNSESSYGVIRMFGEVLEGETLKDLQKQYNKLGDVENIIIEIASPGGSVSEGLEIMVWMDMLSQQGKTVITLVVANAYSIASLIMLSANMRLISKHGKVMVHNPMVPELQYVNANDLEEYVNSLRDLESMMYELYKTFTKCDEETIKSLMDNETYLLPQEAVDFGFADTVVDVKPKSYQMATNIKKEINMHKTLNILNKVISVVNKANFVNQLYYTEAGSDLEITQADPSTYSKGDRTSVEEGEVKLSDGATLTIKDFVITDISKEAEVKTEEVVDEFNEGPAPATEEVVEEVVEAPAAEEVVEVPVTEEVVETPAAEVVEEVIEEEEVPTKVIEKTKSTETTKEVVAKEEVDAEAKVEEDAEAKAKEDAEVEAKAKDDAMAKLEARFEALEKEAAEAKAKVAKLEANAKEQAKFEALATQAIDVIATNTSSSFKPDAKSVVKPGMAGSIFSQMKERAGLN